MTTFSVIGASKKKDVQGRNGPMQVLTLQLRNGDQSPIVAEWFTKATTPIPAENDTLEGEVTRSNYGYEFKKARPPGAGYQKSPQEVARIVRQHSQEMALRYVMAKGQTTFEWADLIKLVDAFDNDVRRAAEATR